jgi:dipeptidyl aminopeptidase/acylaminoacyl peptidase
MRAVPLVMLVTLVALGCGRGVASLPASDQLTLREARQQFQTRLTARMIAPQEYPEQPPYGVEVIHYESQGRQLLAWLARPKGTGPHPAILYAHGGFALEAEDFETVQPFVKAGFVVLLPAWRGENGNPGHFELCYGEVDDASAALSHLVKLPGVDARRVFAFGHSSSGGTIAMLLAEIASGLRAVVAASPLPNMRGIVEVSGLQPIQNVHHPFDWRDPVETDLRSPGRHLANLQCPLAVYVGDREDEPIINQAKGLGDEAKMVNKPITVEAIQGADHFAARNGAVLKAIIWFKSMER